MEAFTRAFKDQKHVHERIFWVFQPLFTYAEKIQFIGSVCTGIREKCGQNEHFA